ncbi:MAG: hypothetical protein EXR72_22450 [Myxococcales bacterium]|nr:hypothetical protein [Myxococcales bacterium]
MLSRPAWPGIAAAVVILIAGCKRTEEAPVPSPPSDAAIPRVVVLQFPPVAASPPDLAPQAKPTPDSVCPADMAPIPGGGCIDRHEASPGKGALGAASGKGTTVVALAVAGKRPFTAVSVFQAERACKNAKKRLCTEHEWRAACHGVATWPRSEEAYSYGPKYEERRCNDWHASNQGASGVVPTGSFSRCVTPRGVFDLSNNVAEIVSTPHTGDYYSAFGGSYMNVVLDSNCDEDEYVVRRDGSARDVGFRCCSDGQLAQQIKKPGS